MTNATSETIDDGLRHPAIDFAATPLPDLHEVLAELRATEKGLEALANRFPELAPCPDPPPVEILGGVLRGPREHSVTL